MSYISPTYVQDMPKISQRYSKNMAKIYAKIWPRYILRYGQDMLKMWPRYAKNMSWICLGHPSSIIYYPKLIFSPSLEKGWMTWTFQVALQSVQRQPSKYKTSPEFINLLLDWMMVNMEFGHVWGANAVSSNKSSELQVLWDIERYFVGLKVEYI